MSLFNLLLSSNPTRNTTILTSKLIGRSHASYKHNHMKKFSRVKRLLCSSLLITFLLSVGICQTPLTGGTPYDVDFNTEAFDLSGGNANCNGQSYTFEATGAGWEIANAEGVTCGTTNDCGSYTSGNNDAQFETSLFDITCAADVEIEVIFDLNDDMQDADDCSTGPNGCGNDNLIFYYDLDGAGPVQFANPSLCDLGNFTETSPALNGSTLKVIVEGGTQANDEVITIENIIFNSVAGPAPANDICDDANEVLIGSATGNTNSGYTNDCATMDGFSTCPGPINEASVWFEYTNPGNVSSVILSFASQGIGVAAWEVYDACGGATIQEECDATNDLVFDVCDVTTPFLIQLSSALAEVGEFDITVTEILAPTPDLVKGTDITIDEMGANNGVNDCIVCVDDIFDLTALDPNDANGDYIYDWTDFGGNTYTGATIPGLGANVADHNGTWTLIATDINGCSAESTFDITVNELPLPANPIVTAACENGDLILEFGGPETIVDWEDPSGALLGSTADPITITTNAQAGTDDGTYWVIVTDADGCSNSADVNVTLNPPPSAIISPDPLPLVCPGELLSFCEMGGDAVSWMWSSDIGGSFSDNTIDCPESSNMSDGENITVVVTDINGCTSSETITVSLSPGPANDDCGAAEVAPTGMTAGDNTCATPDANLCADADHVVYYTYTTVEANATITISVTGAATAVDAWTDCTGTPYDASVGCASTITLTCVPAGTMLTIPVGSATGGTGAFDLEIMDVQGGVANDTCDDPIDATPSVLCTAEPFSGVTAGACPEPLGGPASCTQNNDPTIWFEFTADANATSVDFTNVSGDFQILSGGCPATTGETGCFSGDTNFIPIPGATYLVSGTDTGGAGSVGFDITMNVSPANDMCANAIDASSGSESGDTACATPDANYCGASGDHVVYYTYTVAATGTVAVSVEVDGATDATIEVWDGCGGADYDPNQTDCVPEMTLTCVPAGTVLTIPVGSTDGGEGTFNLSITETATSGPTNDLCDDADFVDITLPCTPFGFTGTTVDACPETFAGGCTQMTDATVWFTFTTLGGSTTADFTNVVGEFQLFTDCAGSASGGCITADGSVAVNPSTQYWVSATVNGGEGDVSFEVALLEAPANDACGAAEDASGGSASGTTGCASADASFCGASGDHVVYYTYTVAGPGSVTVTIDVTVGDAADAVAEAWTDCAGTDFDATIDCSSSISLDCVPAGTVLTIPVGSVDGGEGTFDLAIAEIPGSGPANDLCDDAENIAIPTPCTPFPGGGTTVGACPETFAGGCTQMTDPTVWFTFTTLAGSTMADFTNVVGEFQLFTDCAGSASGGCIAGDMAVTIDPSTQYWVSATVNGGEGDVSFDIALLEAPTNDACDAAEDASGGSASGTTGCASADANFCGASADHVVYYSYTVAGPGAATVQIDVTAGDASDIAIEAWADCGGTDYDPAQADCGTSFTLECVPAGTVLTIPVGSVDGGEGTFDLAISETDSGITNDDCSGAEVVTVTIPCEPVGITGTTVGACPEGLASACTQDADPTVWYTFTTLAGTTSIDFTNVNGTFELFTDCPFMTSASPCISADQGVGASASTTYWMSATVAGGEGDFDVEIAFLEAPANDLCADAIGAGTAPTTGNNNCASADPTLCGGTDHVVYYTYTVAGPGTVTLDVTVAAGTAVDLSFALQNGCGGDIIDESCNADGTLSADCIPEGTEIIIPIGTADGNTGDFEVSVMEIPGGTGVANDECSDATIIAAAECVPVSVSGSTTDACPELFTNCGLNEDPAVWFQIDLPAGATSGVFDGITNGASLGVFDGCGTGSLSFGCVTGDMTIPGLSGSIWVAVSIPGGEGSFDFNFTALVPPPNDLCDGATDGSGGGTTCCAGAEGVGCADSNTVWHQFTPSDPNATVVITVNNGTINGTMGVGVFTGTDCSSLIDIDPCLGTGGSIERTVSCLGGDPVFVQISSGADDCGEYDISFVEQSSDCDLGSECGSDFSLLPPTNGAPACQEACNIGVCNEDCLGPTIWFEVTTDDLASGMLLEVDAEFTPSIVMLQDACDGDVAIGCATAASSNIAVQPNTTYYVGVGISSGDPGDFELCVTTVLDFANCSVGELEITRPENPGEDPNGPYCPGEKVEFCYSVDFNIDPIGTGNNCQWIQGLVPAIGGGWDQDVCPIEGQGPAAWAWFDDDEVDYQISTSIYGLSTNCAGDPILTSSIGGGLGIGTPLPGGWYFTSNGGGGCTNDGNPNTMWGLPGGCGGSQTVEFCFELAANNPSDITECTDPCFSDMGVSIFVFADGQTGCWSQNTCAADTPTEFLDGSLDCGTLVFVEGPEEAEICSGDQLNLDYTAADGSSDILLEICEIDPNITGATFMQVFSGGTAQIADVLENIGTDPAVVIYCLSAVSMDGSICNGPKLEVEVTVFPEILIEFDEPYNICFDGQEEIVPMPMGGSGNYVMYEWSNGETTPTIQAPLTILSEPAGTYQYSLTVTDDLGCTAEATVEYIIRPEVNHMLNATADFACLDGADDLAEICAIIDAGEDNEPFTYDWIFDSDLIASPDEFCLVIDDENSAVGTYEIFVEVTDEYGCVYLEGPIFFSVENGPNVQQDTPFCIPTGGGDVEYTFEVCDDNGGVAEWSLFDETCSIQLDGPFSGNCVTFFVTPFAPGDDIPVTYCVQAVDLATNCVAFESVEIVPPAIPDIPEMVSGCSGDTGMITLGNPGDFETWTWCDGFTQDDVTYTFTFDEDEICFLSVFDLNGCEIIYEIEIDVSDGATVEIEGSLSFCSAPGAFTTLCATPNDPSFGYLWSTGETTQCIDVSTAGPISVEVNVGTCTASDDVVVEVGANLIPIVNGGDVCIGSSVLLTTGQTFATYAWTDTAGNTIAPTNPATPWEIEVTAGGTYTVNVSDGSCDGSGSLTVNESTPPTADIMPASPCNSTENGNITTLDLATLVMNATGNVSFLNPSGAPLGVTLIDYNGLPMGPLTYTVVVEGQQPCDDTLYDLIINVQDCGCPSLELFSIGDFCTDTNTDIPLPSFLSQNTDTDGTFTVEDAGGNPAAIQSDATGQLTVDMSTAPGTYTLVYTLNNTVPGCLDFTSITFNVDTPPTPVLVTPDPLCNSDATGGNTMIDLDTLVSGAVGFWKDAAGTQLASTIIDFNGQPIGQTTYFFETTDAMGVCNNISPSVIISVVDCDCPVIGLNPLPGPLCQTDGEVNIGSFLIVGTEAGQWTVTDPNGDLFTLGTGSAFDPDGLQGGTYTFIYTLSGSVPATCDDFVMGTIEVIEQLENVVLSPISVCGSDLNPIFPTVIDLTSIPELAGYSGSWSAPGNFNGGVIDNESAVDFTGILPSDIIFTFTTDNAVAPCENLNINLVVNVANCDCPIVILTDTEVCNNDGLIDLDGQLNPASAPGVFSYDSGPETVTLNGTEFDANGVDGGEYLFIYTIDPGSLLPGCPETDSIVITVSEPSFIDLGDDLTACGIQSTQGESILNLEILTGGAQGSWTSDYPDPIASYESVSFLGLPQGESYTFTFTGLANGSCDAPIDEIIVTVIDCDCPNLLLEQDESLCSDNGTIDITDFLTDNIVDGSLSIQDIDGNPVTTNGDIFEANGLDEGEYLVIFTPDVAPPADCVPDTASIFVVAPPSAGVPADPAMFCEEDGDVQALADLLEGESAGGSWQETSDNPSNNSAFDDTNGTFNTDGQTPGVYTFEYFFDTSNSPCDPVQETVVVEIEATPNADAGPGGTIDCDNNSITLGGSGSSTGAEFEYTWLNEAGETIYQGDQLDYTVMSGGDFTLVVTNTLTGCSETSSALVQTDEAFPSFTLSQSDISCFGFTDGSLTLNDDVTGTPPYVFLLNGPSAINLPPDGQSWFDLGPGNYTISLVDGIGCETSQSAIIVEPAEMNVEIGNDDFQLAIGDTVNLNVTNLLDMSMVESVTWTQDGEVICEGNTADGTLDGCIPLPVEPPLIPTEYCLIVVTDEGCTLVDCRSLQAQDVRDVYFPTVITDFDGDIEANTTFYVHTDEFVVGIPSFAIYDRWGELIHSYEGGFPNDPAWGWNGYFNGEQAAQGVYVYIIELEYGNGETEIFTGSITVTR